MTRSGVRAVPANGRTVPRLGIGVLAIAVAGVAVVAVGAPHASSGVRATRGPTTIAVLDTGIDPALHLDGSIARAEGASTVPGEGLDDHDGHGSKIASIVHAAAPQARIVPIKVSGADGTSDSRIAAGLDRARHAGARIVLIALAGAEPLPQVRRAMARLRQDGVLVVAAAGNDGVDLDAHPRYPAAYASEPNVVAVASVDDAGHLLGSSNRGRLVRARGQGASVDACGLAGRRATATGTSPAAALVAAAATRRAAAVPGLGAGALRRDLQGSIARAGRAHCA